jgi:hypothetical protein
MAGPFLPAREAQPLDLLEQGAAGNGWDGLEELFKPHLHNSELQPSDNVAQFLYLLSREPKGRQVIEWLMDITIRQPLRITGRSIEETALLATGKQGINGVGEAVLAAIAHGEKLTNQPKQDGAGS